MKDNIFECVIPKGKGIIAILGGTGDTKIFWNKKNKDEVENARQTFNKLVREKKFAAFSVSKMGRKSKKVTEFDPNIQKLILIPPMAGGAFLESPLEQRGESASPQIDGMEKQEHTTNKEAEIKAMTLLKKQIGEERFIQLMALGYFEVEGKYGKYLLSVGSVRLHRFDEIGKKKRPLLYELCIDVDKKVTRVPRGDKLLSFYLSIKKDENKFIETANFRYVSTIDEFEERSNR